MEENAEFPNIVQDLFPGAATATEPEEPEPEPQLTEVEQAIVSSLAVLEQNVDQMVRALPAQAPQSCDNTDTDECCQQIMYVIQEYVYQYISEISGLSASLHYRWESWVIQGRDMTWDENEPVSTIRFSCRSEFTFTEYNERSEVRRFDRMYEDTPGIFEMQCVKPIVRRFLKVMRTTSYNEDIIGICTDRRRNMKNKAYEDRYTRVLGNSVSASGLDFDNLSELSEDTMGETICTDYSGYNSEAAPSDDTELVQKVRMMAYVGNFDFNQGSAPKYR